MKTRIIDLRDQSPIFDIVSFGRCGSGISDQAEIEQVSQTLGRAPEVPVKVSGGVHTLKRVGGHLAYIGREIEIELETDIGFDKPGVFTPFIWIPTD